jgi:hypothetical protein
MILNKTKLFITMLLLILTLSMAHAYSGFNREYYTNNYYNTYYTPAPTTTYTVNGYINMVPNNYTYSVPLSTIDYSYPSYTYTTYYPNRTYQNVYYPRNSMTVIQPTYYNTGRSLNVWSTDSGWGISYTGNRICSIYGYC